MLMLLMSGFRRSLLARLVVVGLLAWAVTDLTVPRLCAEDSATTQTSNGPTSGSQSHQDDCFCCCHHLVPAAVDVSTVLIISIDPPDLARVNSPDGVPRSLFHPPLSL